MVQPTMPMDTAGQPLQAIRPGASQAVALGPLGNAALGLDDETVLIRVVADENFHISMGSPVTTASAFVPAGLPEYFRINKKETVEVLETALNGGTVILTECT